MIKTKINIGVEKYDICFISSIEENPIATKVKSNTKKEYVNNIVSIRDPASIVEHALQYFLKLNAYRYSCANGSVHISQSVRLLVSTHSVRHFSCIYP
jgi:hypothetical protein